VIPITQQLLSLPLFMIAAVYFALRGTTYCSQIGETSYPGGIIAPLGGQLFDGVGVGVGV
jgi:hypothetical protein